MAIDCGHKFDRIAILDWMGISKTCPECKRSISKLDPVKLITDEETPQRPLKKSKTETQDSPSTTSETSSSSTSQTAVQDMQPLVESFNECFAKHESIINTTLVKLKDVLKADADLKDIALDAITVIGVFRSTLNSIKKDYTKFDKSCSSQSLNSLLDTCKDKHNSAIEKLQEEFKRNNHYSSFSAPKSNQHSVNLQKFMDSFLSTIKRSADTFRIVWVIYKGKAQS